MTTVSSYVPGDWTAVVNEGFVAMLGPATSPAIAERLWFDSQQQIGFIDGLSLLASEGFGSMQPFVLSVRGEDAVTHVAVRGDVIVDAQVQGTVVTIDGHGVATWTERNLGGLSALAIRLPGGSEGPDLPLVAGVVRAGGLRAPHGSKVGTADDSSDSEEPAPGGDYFASVPVAVAPREAPREAPRKKAPPRTQAKPQVSKPRAQPRPRSEPVMAAPDITSETFIDPLPPEDDGLDDEMTIQSANLAKVRSSVPEYSSDEAVSEAPAAQLVLNTGLIVALDRPVLLGRAPQAARVSSREMPRLVAVPSPQQDISRTHAEVRMDGADVLVTDLDSTNGVHVLRPGGGARRLRPGEPRVLALDETIDLGDGVTFVVERMR
ncbi:MAG: FHA domain-containing protein [Micrococcales bacterium]|nr:FHA domain-containing protein [Micrococcales bacterium]MCL2667132.1 FHA domain-containing protein [Micrococcales bacterium]